MTVHWRAFLEGKGAVYADDGVYHFGDANAELRHAAHGDVLLDLPQLGLIRVSGDDACTFLQAQLTQDVRQLDTAHHVLAGYCTAQGRMLAVLRVFRTDTDIYYLQLPRALRASTLARLQRYVMRAKVALVADDDRVAIAIAGPRAASTVQSICPHVPHAGELQASDRAAVLALPGPTTRYVVITTAAEAQTLWNEWERDARPVGSGIWNWFEIASGLPTVVPATAEAFVPQMANLDALGAISLTKGCYPGQEIVARMHYLGRLKQRMYRAWVDSPRAPVAGDAIYSPSLGEQSAGTVVMAHPAPEGGNHLLAVIQIAAAQVGEVRLHSVTGPQLTLLSLPYSLPKNPESSANR